MTTYAMIVWAVADMALSVVAVGLALHPRKPGA